MQPASDTPAFIADLLRPTAFPHPADDIQLRETHISWVVLAGAFAYKVKKPVNLGFVDFSTLAGRQRACEEEVVLNRRLCPSLYLGVVDIVENDGRFTLSGTGRAAEPAVKMRRLPEAGLLPVRLEHRTADARLMVRLADKLAAFHASAATGPQVDAYGSPACIRRNWDENYVETEHVVGRVQDARARASIDAYVSRFLEQEDTLLRRRVELGRIRDGHGDLHVGNVCSSSRDIFLFDCLEFDPRFRCADVAAEVAFLAMDLDHHGRADLAGAFTEAYIRASGDTDLPHLVDFYKCYRAFVRAKVLSMRLDQPHLEPAEAEQIADQARAYFDLAFAYTARPTRPALVVSMGLPASGKSTLAELARRAGLVHLSSDVVRKELAGHRATDRLEANFRAGLYAPATTRRTYAVMRRRAAAWLRRGQSVVLDATYGQRSERSLVRQLARRSGASLVVLECHAPEAVLRERLEGRGRLATSESDARIELWPALRNAFVEPLELPERITIDTRQPLARCVAAGLTAVLAATGTDVLPTST